ncbi:MAG: DUF1573 domain-containing protein [Bradyrhizobiaceae bacterium]|nr:DUF1573 domain-containing protein [Bradyrhizobiaceae bacterium]
MNCKLASIVFAIVLSAASAAAQPAIEVSDTLDFGTVVPEQKLNELASVHGKVIVRNNGDSVLVISDMHPSCGCTTPKLEKDTISPGEQTTLNVGLNLPTLNGELNKTVSIYSNDPKHPVKVLHIHADVQRPIQLSSSFIPFNKGVVGDTILGTLRVSIFGTEPITLETEVHGSKLVLISPAKATLKPGESMELTVGYVADRQGVFSVQVFLKTSAKGYESFDIRGYGTVDAKE